MAPCYRGCRWVLCQLCSDLIRHVHNLNALTFEETRAGAFVKMILSSAMLYTLYGMASCMVDVLAARSKQRAAQTRSKVDDLVVPLVAEAAKRVLGTIFIIEVLMHLNVDMSAVIATLAVGSLTISFAAQEYIKSFFGILVVVLSKPLEVGDEVEIAGVSGYGMMAPLH